jgi:hypothetical protein
MVSFYTEFMNHFRASKEAHYLASMKDLIAWIKSFTFATSLDTGVNIGQVLYNEGLRLASLKKQSWVVFNEIDLSESIYSRIHGGAQCAAESSGVEVGVVFEDKLCWGVDESAAI